MSSGADVIYIQLEQKLLYKHISIIYREKGTRFRRCKNIITSSINITSPLIPEQTNAKESIPTQTSNESQIFLSHGRVASLSATGTWHCNAFSVSVTILLKQSFLRLLTTPFYLFLQLISVNLNLKQKIMKWSIYTGNISVLIFKFLKKLPKF